MRYAGICVVWDGIGHRQRTEAEDVGTGGEMSDERTKGTGEHSRSPKSDREERKEPRGWKGDRRTLDVRSRRRNPNLCAHAGDEDKIKNRCPRMLALCSFYRR